MNDAAPAFTATAAPPAGSRPGPWLLLGLAALAPAVFALVTSSIWEDFFITYRCSLNLVHGDGLVYEAGRRIHAFTSPLGTLLPAGLSWLLRTDDPLAVMAAFRLGACLTLAGAWALVMRRRPGVVALATLAGFWLMDAKLAAYSTNGMETAGLVFFVVLAWTALLDNRSGLAGLALGGAMWTRPDGFVFVGTVVVGVLILPGGVRPGWRHWARMAIVAALLYAPWFFWAWFYYGSPVPNTIVAKGSHVLGWETLRLIAAYPWRFLFGHCAAHDAFLPPYFFFGGWPEHLWWYGKILSLAAAAAALWPACPRPARAAGIAFVLGGVYLTATARAPWYFPAWEVLAYVAVAGGVAALGELLRSRRLWLGLLGGTVGLLVLIQGALFVAIASQLWAQQRVIEWGLRQRIGLDLRRLAHSRNDRVFLEPLGYIGYYSGLAMRDTPGLCAPEVIALRQAGIRSMAGLIDALRPEWAVLRIGEFAAFSPQEVAAFDRDYELRILYDARPEIDRISWLPGRDFLLFDAQYGLWRRRSTTGGPR